MIFKQIKSGGDRNFAYLIACKKANEGILADPSPDPHMVMEAVKQENVKIKFIVNTHSHIDHSAGNDYFRKSARKTGIGFVNCDADTRVKDGCILNIGEVKLEFISTPGHTPDSICIKAGNKLVTGDTLFVGKVGGTWSREDAKTEMESLKKIIAMDPSTEIWPGHDYGIRPNSTVELEIKQNPFIKRLSNFDEFLWLKQNWAKYKSEHGLK